MTDWTSKEARKVRAKVNGWAASTCRVDGPALGFRTELQAFERYAAAIGTDEEGARLRAKAQFEHLARFEAEEQNPTRRYTDARPKPYGPDWSGKHAAAIKRRCQALADRLCTTEKRIDPEIWPSSWKPLQGI